ncbi:MAG: hypothetical protein EDM05_016050 [Leptolyngbya sp. IPPAS B-1204]
MVDLETRRPLPPEKQGLVMIRGDQVMLGYYKIRKPRKSN